MFFLYPVSSVELSIDIKDIDERINETNSLLENYFKQYNLSFISNSSINKSDLTAKCLHFKEQGSSKFAKYFIKYVY